MNPALLYCMYTVTIYGTRIKGNVRFEDAGALSDDCNVINHKRTRAGFLPGLLPRSAGCVRF